MLGKFNDLVNSLFDFFPLLLSILVHKGNKIFFCSHFQLDFLRDSFVIPISVPFCSLRHKTFYAPLAYYIHWHCFTNPNLNVLAIL